MLVSCLMGGFVAVTVVVIISYVSSDLPSRRWGLIRIVKRAGTSVLDPTTQEISPPSP